MAEKVIDRLRNRGGMRRQLKPSFNQSYTTLLPFGLGEEINVDMRYLLWLQSLFHYMLISPISLTSTMPSCSKIGQPLEISTA